MTQLQQQQHARLSDDLLDRAGIAQCRLEFRRQQLGLRELIDGAVEDVKPFLDRCGHALAVEMPIEPLVVYGDAPRLRQAFATLIQNAAEFAGRNGSLQIIVEVQSGSAVIRVQDDAAGIAEHMRIAILKAFTQWDANGPLGQRGLLLVKTIVELHGGTVGVRNEGRDRGSEFTVRLPAMSAVNVSRA